MALFDNAAAKSTQPEHANGTQQTPKARSADSPRHIGLASPNSVPAYLDRYCTVSGNITFEGPAKIDGKVDGEISAKQGLMIGDEAVVTAQIKAGSVLVEGMLSGEIVADQRIEIRPSGRLSGKLTTPVLVVHEGALLDGHCTMQPGPARDLHKGIEFPKQAPSEAPVGDRKQVQSSAKP